MTDPADALRSFRKAFARGGIEVQRCELDPALYVHLDRPDGSPRFTYVRLTGRTATALVNFAPTDPVEGTPCFAIGVAVDQAYRRRGMGKSIVNAAMAEMRHGLGRAGVREFYIEAIVGVQNKASQRVAEQTISATATPVTDSVSGGPALQYMLKVTAGR